MARLPLAPELKKACSDRLRFLRTFVQSQPRLNEVDEFAYTAKSHDLALLDARMHAAELAFALDETGFALEQLKLVVISEKARNLNPIRYLTSAILTNAERPSPDWAAAEEMARDEALVELMCALELADYGQIDPAVPRERSKRFAAVRRRARVPYLRPLFTSDFEHIHEALRAETVWAALHVEYEIRLSSLGALDPGPSRRPLHVIDWTLLVLHVGARRHGGLFSHAFPWLGPEPLMQKTFGQPFRFLYQIAQEIDRSSGDRLQ